MKYLIGAQPTGKLHFGNYLGCIKRGLELQEENEVIFMVANYHAQTTTTPTTELTINELKKLGCKNIVTQNLETLKIFWDLICKCNVGLLSKQPQYKTKKSEYDLGLLMYPLLMAADIIYHNPDVILVGQDQVTHIDLCNDVCKRIGVDKHFNYNLSGELIRGLKDPTQKMSKSNNDVLYLDDDFSSKIKKATSNKEGIDNLLNIGTLLEFTFTVDPYIQTGKFKEELIVQLENWSTQHYNHK